MIDRRRRLPIRSSRGALATRPDNQVPAPVYLSRTGSTPRDVYLSDHVSQHATARIKWLVSTCATAVVGAGAIALAIYGSMDIDRGDGMLASFEKVGREVMVPSEPFDHEQKGLRVAAEKTDMLQASANGLFTRHIIQDTLRQRRAGREFITKKRYSRVVSRLATQDPAEDDLIPPFNPFKLYADTKPIGSDEGGPATSQQSKRVTIKVQELIGGTIPGRDDAEMPLSEVAELAARASEEYDTVPGTTNVAGDAEGARRVADAVPVARETDNLLLVSSPASRTTVLTKTVYESDAGPSFEDNENRVVEVGKGDSLIGLLRRNGAESWQANAIVDAAEQVMDSKLLQIGDQIHMSLAPSPTRRFGMEPVRVSLFSKGQQHRFSVIRNEAGEYVPSASPLTPQMSYALAQSSAPAQKRATLYKSVYHAGLQQGLAQDIINRVLRIHAYDTDYKRRVAPGDAIEMFFDTRDDGENGRFEPGELLFTAITVSGKTRKFYRFRTPDGAVDFFDENGDNAKKFLMRKPVKGSNVRFTSGFGYRDHPLLNRRKMHTGADWAARPGTPILAAGTGLVEEAGRKGGYGNYVRIRHANGYKTAYAHMRRLAKGMRKGVKVRQGQVIGYVGSTGLSSGPHLHYEVLVNNRHVDPMKIHVPRERQLRGKLLKAFLKSKAHIDALMSRPPVITRVAQVDEG